MVDLADVKAQAAIFSPLMLHIIAEFFAGDLHLTVYRQRMLIITAGELLAQMTDRPVTRRGDDLYLPRADGTPGKLSVSIATSSATSRGSPRAPTPISAAPTTAATPRAPCTTGWWASSASSTVT